MRWCQWLKGVPYLTGMAEVAGGPGRERAGGRGPGGYRLLIARIRNTFSSLVVLRYAGPGGELLSTESICQYRTDRTHTDTHGHTD